ncbi:MAG: hypothetical protein J6K37_06935 [Lachnospiraceae bacterium]|nr:hypothetical protein [Lachnospiraceae bacterium]
MKNAIQNEKNEIYISDRLKQALQISLTKTVTVVEAPTGYGKSVAVREFCKGVELPVKWINILDDNPAHAWNSFCRELFRDATTVQRFAKWPFPKAGMQRDYFADAMHEVLADDKMIIVLDDYHQIINEQCIDFFDFFAREFRGKLHMLLISQKAAFPDEELLVATGKINRIGVEDLRLSKEDFYKYLSIYDLNAEADELEQLYEKSEGWISMIYVSVLSIIRGGKSDLSADMEHLIDRVAYGTCSKETQHFLSYLALVQDFTKEQADFFNNGVDSSHMLRELLENHTFFVYDSDAQIYHFHTIFKECIYHRFEKLSLSERCIRYEKMAEYMVLMKDYHQALKWYEKAGNYEGVLSTLELFETMCSTEEDEELMLRCYDNCPKSLFEDYPLCLVLFMWRFYNYGQKDKQQECQRHFEKLMSQIQLAQADKDYLWKAYYVFLHQNGFNNLATMNYYMDIIMSMPQTDELPQIDREIPRTFGIPSIFHMFYMGGQGRLMADELIRQLKRYKEVGIYSYDGMIELVEADFAYYTGNFEQAEMYCSKALRIFRSRGTVCYIISALYLNAHLAYMRGDIKEIKKSLNEMRAIVIREKSEKSRLTYTVDMCEAFFNEHIGYPPVLADWLREEYALPKGIMRQAYPYAVMIKMCVAMRDDKYVEILSAEDEILELVAEYPNNLTIGNIYLVFASAAAALSRMEQAKEYIKKAVEKTNYNPVMLYAKNAAHLVTPLQELAEENESYKPIIEACRNFIKLKKDVSHPHYEEIFPMLTKRENDIALLAVDGFTNKQIAAQLFISENTVKSSLKNIFVKLGIKSRRELLRIAQMGTQF